MENIIYVDRVWNIHNMESLLFLLQNYRKCLYQENIIYEKILIINDIYKGILTMNDIDLSCCDIKYIKYILQTYRFKPNTVICCKLDKDIYWDVDEISNNGVITYEFNMVKQPNILEKINTLEEKIDALAEQVENLFYVPIIGNKKVQELKEHFEELATNS